MKKLLVLLGALVCAFPARAQLTTVQQILYRADGTTCSGSLTITWPTFVSPDGNLNLAGSTTTVVPSGPPGTPGLLSVSLEPGGYSVTYALAPSGCGPASEYWSVPVSLTPVNLATVRTLNPPVPGMSVALSTLSQSGATTGECLTWGGSIWGPSGCGFGVGASLPATCSIGQVFFLTTAPAGLNWYGCTSTNTWIQQGGSGGSSAFSSINSGTNTTATMTVGSGASLTFSGTGTVNANQANGAAIPASAGFLASNASRQLVAAGFTPLNPANNLSDVASAATSFSNLAGFARTSVPTSVVNDANVTGSIATNALTLGWTGTLALTRGGTGASTPSGARTSLGLGTAATENVSTVIGDNGSGGLTVLAGQITSSMLAGSLNAATASALAATPSQCGGTPQQFSTGIAANGNANCAAINTSAISGILGASVGGTGTGTAFTQNSVVFAGASGVYSQDHANFFYDPTTKYLTVGNGIVVAPQTAGLPAFMAMTNGDVSQTWSIETQPSANGGNFLLIDNTHGNTTPFLVEPSAPSFSIAVASTGNSLFGSPSVTDGGYRLDVQSSGTAGTMRIYDQTPTTGASTVAIRKGAGQSSQTPFAIETNSGSTMTQFGGTFPSDSYWRVINGGYFAEDGAGLPHGVIDGNIGAASFGAGLSSQAPLYWSSTTDLTTITPDTGLSRASAGVVAVGDGTAGDASGKVNAAQYQVAGTQISAANLSNGTSGTGEVCLSTGSACTPGLNASQYNFPAQTPGGSLTGGGGSQSITLNPNPAGISGATANQISVYLSGGIGTAEAVLVSGGTCLGGGAAPCTIMVSPANNHSGSWQVGSASDGIGEAACSLPSTGGEVWINSAATLRANVGTCGKTAVTFRKLTGDAVAGSFTLGGSNTSYWASNDSVTNGSIVYAPFIDQATSQGGIVIEPTITTGNTSILWPLYIEQTNSSLISSNTNLNGVGVNMYSSNASPNQNAAVMGFWYSLGGADPFGGDFHGILPSNATAAPNYVIGAQGTAELDSTTFSPAVASYGILGQCGSTASKNCSGVFAATSSGSGGSLFILTTDSAIMTNEGAVLVPANDSNPSYRAFGIVNHANSQNNWFADKGGDTYARGFRMTVVGTAVASASSITAPSGLFHVTGTNAIATINVPGQVIAGTCIDIIPDGAFTTTTAGNIALASTAVVNKELHECYDNGTGKWYPSY